MSHIVAIKTVLKDMEAVKDACKELGLTFKRCQKTYQWWGRSVGDYPIPNGFTTDDLGKCEHAIGVPNSSWEIGVCKLKDGSGYTLMFDFFGSQGRPILEAVASKSSLQELHGLKDRLGIKAAESKCALAERFVQIYGVHKAIHEAKKKQMKVQRFNAPDGTVKLTLTPLSRF